MLGEVSLETGAYDQAIQDISSCLDIQMASMDGDSRYIAETHYQLGTAHLLNKSYKVAVEQLRKAKSVSFKVVMLNWEQILWVPI